MEQSAVEWLEEQYQKQITFLHREDFEQAKDMERQQQGYSEEQLFKIINDFCFDWNYNYKGELSQKEYLIVWFEKFKNK